jgi:hypothetical protein
MGKNQSASNITNIIRQDASGNIAFMSGSTMLMSLNNTGQMSGSAPAVSAVTASYADNFTVRGSLTAQTLVVQTITSSVDFVTGSTRFGSFLTNTHVFSGSVAMNPGGLFVSGSGQVGIGTVNPSSRLEISGFGTPNSIMTQPIIAAYASNGFNLGSDGTNALIGVTNSGTDMVFLKRVGGVYSEAMRITSGGNVGIGTNNPSSSLHVSFTNSTTPTSGTTPSGIGVSFGSGDGNNGGIWFSSIFGGDQGISGIAGIRTSGYQNELTFYTNNTNSARAFSERMRITAAGNIGIGTANPVGPLMIAVPAVGSAIGATNAQTAYDYSRFRIKHYTDSSLGLSIGYAGANHTYIQACYNEGSTAPLLMNPYGGEVRVGTSGLKFANGSTALNYYEEGTFTPNNLNSNMSAVTPTFGRYVRIGNQVTINVRWAVEPGGTGQKYIVFNLPFAFNGAGGVSYTGTVSNYNSGLSAYSSNVGTSVRNSSGSDTQQYVEAVFISNTSTTMLFSMTYFTF